MAEQDSIGIIADPVDKIACRQCGRHLDVSKIASFASVECPECHTKQSVPAKLGQFLLVELLGAGGMGAVYKGLDQSLGRYVAIKVMKQSLGNDERFIENFMREARAAAALNHRNVVQIYSCGQEKGQPYIVMELVSGGRLDEMISGGNPIEEVRALEIGIDVAEGLRAANDVGLIHGDIKPANILFDGEGTAKVADFGLARFISWEQQDGNEIWGTPYYIAPEKARGQKVDHRSDVYSLGATLYHALGAKPPFDGKTATDVVLARLKNPAIGLRVIRPTLQPETADVIARTLETDPFMRYPTYSSLLADLREALRVAKQEQRAIRTKVKKSPVVPVVIVFLMIIAAAVILVAGLRWTKTQHRVQKKKVEQQALMEAQQTVLAEATNAVSPDEALKKPRTIPIVQPFTPAGEAAIASAVRNLVEAKPDDAREELQELYTKSPAIGMGRYWLRLFQSVTTWAAGRDQDALVYLHEIRNALFESVDETQPHPGNMPQAISRYVLKEIGDGELAFEAARWPPWYGDLTEFYMGLDQLRDGQLLRAKGFLESYVAKSDDTVDWPYAFQPFAQVLIQQINGYLEAQREADRMIAAKQAARAEKVLEDYRFNASPLIDPVIAQKLNEVELALESERLEEERAQRRIHETKVQADLDILDGVRTQNLPLVAKKDYRKASSAIVKSLSKMKTSEGQQTLAIYRECYDRMDSLKRDLIHKISKSPYRGQSDLGGDAVGADLSGIRVALGAHGAMVVPWDQVGVRTFLKLTTFYSADRKMTEKERADMTLSMAVFCYENAIFKWAESFTQKAVGLDASLKTKARQLMPDILKE